MLARFFNAFSRAILVVAFVLIKSALVAQSGSVEGDLFVVVAALLIGFFLFFEYFADMPAVIEFRYAPPYNRIRFLIAIIVAVTLCYESPSVLALANPEEPEKLSPLVGIFSIWPLPGNYLYSILEYSDAEQRYWLYDNLASASALGLLGVFLAGIYIWISPWPLGRDGFNLWPNMPSFNPSSGQRASDLLLSIALLNLLLAVALPYAISFGISLAQHNLGFDFRHTPIFTYWVLFLWAAVPLFCLFKAIALLKLCVLAESLRKLESS